MITSELAFRVRYVEVDRMGYVHHSNYAAYFEMGRTELMREYGISYKEVEDSGIILPLSEFTVNFYQPALYDDFLRMETTLQSFTGVRINFKYKIFNQNEVLLAEGATPLVCVSKESKKPVRPPKEFAEKILVHFKH